MEHARKFLLVPSEDAERRGSIKESVKTLDDDMEAILRDKKLTDDEKWRQYRQVLQRYLFLYKFVKKPLKIDLVTKDKNTDFPRNEKDPASEEETLEEAAPTEVEIDRIVETIPQRYQANAKQLLRRIGKDIKWNDNYEVDLEGENLEGSNIIDLINDMVRERRDFHSRGSTQFAEYIRRKNIPRAWVKNKQVFSPVPRISAAPVRTRAAILRDGDRFPNTPAARRVLPAHDIFRTPPQGGSRDGSYIDDQQFGSGSGFKWQRLPKVLCTKRCRQPGRCGSITTSRGRPAKKNRKMAL
jgi:hypothetical protein